MSNTRKRSHKHKRKLTVNRKNRKTRRVKRNPSRKHRSRRKFFGGVLTKKEKIKKKRLRILTDPNNTSKLRARYAAKKKADDVQNAKANVRNPIPTKKIGSIESLYDTNRKYMIQYVVDNPGVSTYEVFKNHVTEYLKEKKPLPTNDYELNMLYEKTKAEEEKSNHTPDKKYKHYIDTINQSPDNEKTKAQEERNNHPQDKEYNHNIDTINQSPDNEKKLKNMDEEELENIDKYIDNIDNIDKLLRQSSVTDDIQIDKENLNEQNIFYKILNKRKPLTKKLNALRNDNTTYYTEYQLQELKKDHLHSVSQPIGHRQNLLTQQHLKKEKKKKEEDDEYLRQKKESIKNDTRIIQKQKQPSVPPKNKEGTTKASHTQSLSSQDVRGRITLDWLKLKANQHDPTDSTDTFLKNAKNIDDTEQNIKSLITLMDNHRYNIKFSDINDINDINDTNEKTYQFKEVKNYITDFIKQYGTTDEVTTIIEDLLKSKNQPPMHFSSQ